jgi:hypothetical protein
MVVDLLEDGRPVGREAGEQDFAASDADAALGQRRGERWVHRWCQHPVRGATVQNAAVLGHDQINPILDVREVRAQFGQDAAGHHDHQEALLAHTCQGGQHVVVRSAAGGGERAVEVDGDHAQICDHLENRPLARLRRRDWRPHPSHSAYAWSAP